MNTRFARRLLLAAALTLSPAALVLAQTPAPEAATSPKIKLDAAPDSEGNWYFSWGYSRQQYAPSDIHVSQPTLGNDFIVHQAGANDFPAGLEKTLRSIASLDFTTPQENVRIGKFMNPEKTFALEFSLDHSKYNTYLNQTANVTGMIGGKGYNGPMVLDAKNFYYALHNGLNHLMINGVWFKHLAGPEKQPGEWQWLSRAGAGILLPHAENTILGNSVEVGPKTRNVCCFSAKDWWQVNGWTAGVELGVRYRVYKTMYLELTTKGAYGVLRSVPVYQGTAHQKIWMTEQVLSAGFTF